MIISWVSFDIFIIFQSYIMITICLKYWVLLCPITNYHHPAPPIFGSSPSWMKVLDDGCFCMDYGRVC